MCPRQIHRDGFFLTAALFLFLMPRFCIGGPQYHLRLSADYPNIITTADQTPNVTYSRMFHWGYDATFAVGTSWGSFDFDLAYEHWIAGRAYEGQVDWLRYTLAGIELGFHRFMNPLMYWNARLGALYPLDCRIQSNTDTYFSPAMRVVSYQFRLGFGFRLYPWVNLEFQVGYRQANLGDMIAGSTSYLSGEAFTLTGMVYGVTFSFHS